jgi:sucrose phosphorylase
MRTVRNQVQLVAYADRLGGSIPGLREVLDGPLSGLFGGVHLLPFFDPYDGADAGFDPADHLSVDPRLGTWDDVRALAAGRDVVVDLIVNHVSVDSPEFRDFLAHGRRSAYAGMFLTLGTVFPQGATEADLLRIYRPRPGLPFTPVVFADGGRALVWTTFTSRQVDLDVGDEHARRHLFGVLERLAANGVRMVRLDAVGYAVKTPGTSCFMTPETFAFIGEMTGRARGLGMDVLVEVHSHFEQQVAIGSRVDRVYDFALPPLVLHGLFTGDVAPLRHWLAIRPNNAVTVLDTHDGIGVIDVGPDQTGGALGLLAPAQISEVVERIHDNSGGTSRLATGAAASNLDLYQVNCTFYDALGGDDERYLLARLVQLFTPGIPQVYYVGLLAGRNDMDLLARTGVGRDVNRHHYTAAEIAEALDRPVVRRLGEIIRLRNTHPAFGGELTVGGTDDLVMTWRDGPHEATLTADLGAGRYTVTHT